MSHKDCFLRFPLTDQKLHQKLYAYDGYSLISLTVVFDKADNDIKKMKPDLGADLAPEIEARLDSIYKISQEMCEKNGIPYKGLMPLDHGKAGVVVLVNDEHVIRMQRGRSPERYTETDDVLPAIHYLFDESCNLTFELMRRLDTDSITPDDINRKCLEARENGVVVFDAVKKNFGRDKKDGKVYIIDPDCYSVTPETGRLEG